MVSNSYFSLWNSLKLGFCLYHSTKPVFLKVFNNQHIAKSNGQFLVFILFDLSVAVDIFYKSVIEICSSLCYQDTIFLISYYLIGCSLVPGWFLPFSMIDQQAQQQVSNHRLRCSLSLPAHQFLWVVPLETPHSGEVRTKRIALSPLAGDRHMIPSIPFPFPPPHHLLFISWGGRGWGTGLWFGITELTCHLFMVPLGLAE